MKSPLAPFESEASGYSMTVTDLVRRLAWTADGLIPVIAQQYDTGEVLMMAWMNSESLALPLSGRQVIYWSRSRQKLWRKGESSGQVQQLVELRTDCDGDALLALVDQTGPACHTGRQSCFFWKIEEDVAVIDRDVIIPKEDLYGQSE